MLVYDMLAHEERRVRIGQATKAIQAYIRPGRQVNHKYDLETIIR